MESYELNACVDRLNRLKKDVQYRQKKGLPFILASVIIWALILLSRIAAADLRTANLMTFICCCLLIPLATLFSKLLKADIFRKTGNPLNSLVYYEALAAHKVPAELHVFHHGIHGFGFDYYKFNPNDWLFEARDNLFEIISRWLEKQR